jgi:hypothetical protein
VQPAQLVLAADEVGVGAEGFGVDEERFVVGFCGEWIGLLVFWVGWEELRGVVVVGGVGEERCGDGSWGLLDELGLELGLGGSNCIVAAVLSY